MSLTASDTANICHGVESGQEFHDVRMIVSTLSKTFSSNMSAIGSLVFCTDCGNLLDTGDGEENAILVCEVCGARCKGTTALFIRSYSISV